MLEDLLVGAISEAGVLQALRVHRLDLFILSTTVVRLLCNREPLRCQNLLLQVCKTHGHLGSEVKFLATIEELLLLQFGWAPHEADRRLTTLDIGLRWIVSR